MVSGIRGVQTCDSFMMIRCLVVASVNTQTFQGSGFRVYGFRVLGDSGFRGVRCGGSGVGRFRGFRDLGGCR